MPPLVLRRPFESSGGRRVAAACLAVLAAAAALGVAGVHRPSLAPAAAQEEAGVTPVLVFLSWDGTPAWLLRRMLDEGKLPNVRRLAAAGAMAEASTGNWASKTAAGHAAVFTGAYGDVNGITSNSVALMPAAAHTIAEAGVSGYNADSLLAEPIWVTAAKQGRRVAALSVTQSQPFAMHNEPGFVSAQGVPGFAAPKDKLWMADGYGARVLSGPAVYRAKDVQDLRTTDAATTRWTGLPGAGPYREFTLKVADTTLNAVVFGGADDPAMALSRGLDLAGADAVLRPTPPSLTDTAAFGRPIPLTSGASTALTYFRLYELAADGSDFLLWRSYGSDMATAMTHPGDSAALDEAAGAFTGNSRLWNGLGPLLPDGGDGTAERRYAETALLVNRWFREATVWAIRRDMADVYLSYSPFPDEGHHVWMGLIDPESTVYDPALAAKLWPVEEAILADNDRYLGAVMDALEATGRPWDVALFSDHGFMGVGRTFYPNRVLRAAGLAAADAGGGVTVAGTSALYALTGSAFVTVNGVVTSTAHTPHLGGIVSDGRWDDVAQAATQALLGARDPDTGKAIVTAVLRPDEHEGLGMGGPHGGDLYLDLAPGYTFGTALTDGPIAEARGPYQSGDHIMFTLRSRLQSIAVLGGDQIRDVGVIAPIRSIDIAPTMAMAVGLPAPAQARGHVLGEVVLPWAGGCRCANFVPRVER